MKEWERIVKDFSDKEVSPSCMLDQERQELIRLVALTCLQTPILLKKEVDQALNLGLPIETIQEALIQTIPYLGYPKAFEALEEVEEVLKQKGLAIDCKQQTTTYNEERFKQGLAVQYEIFGQDLIDANRNNVPEELKPVQEYLTRYCFGDFYTRKGIELKDRELLTFVIIATMGGCDPQLKAHVQGNLNVGNDRRTLISAVFCCVPLWGFPRSLNAISCINEIAHNKD